MANPFDTLRGGTSGAKKQKNEDQGVVAGIMGKGLHYLSGGLIDEESAKKEARGVTDFVSPSNILPAFGGAAINQARALPTSLVAAGEAAGLPISTDAIEKSPLAFAVDTANLRRQQELANSGNTGLVGAADKFNAILGTLSPIGQNLQQSFAETGLRGGGLVGSAISQAGLTPSGRMTPNEAMERLGVESYGQAAQEGRAGVLGLTDLLNIAPALKGAGAATSLNPLAETAAGAKIANVGTALERAPIAPYSAPAKALYQAAERAGIGGAEFAFPRLAEAASGAEFMGHDVAAKALRAPGAVAERVGQTWQGAADRAEMLKNQGALNRANRTAIDTAIADVEAAAEQFGPESAEALEKSAALQDFTNELRQEALTQTQYNRARWAHEQAIKMGIPQERLVPTDAFGRIVNEVDNEIATSGIGSAEEFPQAMKGISRKTAPAVEQAALDIRGIEPIQGGTVGVAGRELRRAIEKEYPDIAARTEAGNFKFKEQDVVPKGAVREIPENFTADSIQSHMKGLDSPALPEHLGKGAVKAWDQMMTAWKTGVLPLRPAWHTTNIVGNTMGALLMGEVSPIWFAQNIGRIMDEAGVGKNKNKAGLELHGVSTGRGLGTEAAFDIKDISNEGIRGKIKRKAQASYAFNEKVDDFAHTAVALQQYDKLVAAGVPASQAVDMANRFSLKTMGDFGNMSSAERSFVRRVLPFYPWYKHVAKATLRFPMESPGRFLQSQAMANRLTGGPVQTPEGADFLKGAIPMGGGRFLRIGGDIGLNVENNPLLDPTAALQGAAPPLQWLGAAGGLNLARGRELQTAPGQSKASALAGYAINQSPVSKTLADVYDLARGQGGIVRGDTRAPIVSGGRPLAESGQGAGFLPPSAVQYLTGLSYQEPNLARSKGQKHKAEKQERSKERNYEKAVKRKPKK